MTTDPAQIARRKPGYVTFVGLLAGTVCIAALSRHSDWIRSWLVSGCAVETLIIVVGPAASHAPLPAWLLLVALNAVFAIVSTSWLLYDLFTIACWILVVLSCLVQYAYVSSFARARLRWLMRHLHFYQDKVALFRVPSVLLDLGVGGQVALQGITFSILEFRLECHGIATSLIFGNEHEISVYCDRLELALFRRIYIDEVYVIHSAWKSETGPSADTGNGDPKIYQRATEHTEGVIAEDNIRHEAKEDELRTTNKPSSSPVGYVADVDAEAQYRAALDAILIATRVHVSRKRARQARNDSDPDSEQGEIEYRTVVCAELRRMGSIPLPTSNSIKASRLAAWTAPMTRVFQRIPVLPRLILVPLSYFHPVECPSVCLSGSGGWASSILAKKFAEYHDTDDARIQDLISEITEWLATAEFCVDFTNLKGHGQVPFRSSYDIQTGLSSSNVVATRMDAGITSIRRVVQLKGADASFVIPSCLLPHHGHLIPPKPPTRRLDEQIKMKVDGDHRAEKMADDGSDNDTADVHMSVRATLPARFDDSFFSFATTAIKASQMIDIDEEEGMPPEDNPPLLNSDKPPEEDKDRHSVRRAIKQKLAHGRLGEAIRVPAHSVKQMVHKEVKKTTVDQIDGAWFAKWTRKAIDQLEWVNGDLGYSNTIPVELDKYRM